MAEILIMARAYTHPDPLKDQRGVHKPGDIVNIKPDGWSDRPGWSGSDYCCAKTGKFVLVKIPGLKIPDAIAWREPWTESQGEESVIIRRHRFAITQTALDEVIANGGVLTLTKSQFRDRMIDKTLIMRK